MPKRGFAYFCLLILAAVNVSAQAGEEAAGWSAGDHVRARIMPVTNDSVLSEPLKERQALLEIRLSEGWHTYWKVPGDSGLPPRFDWSGSDNLADAQIFWPFPERYDEFGLQVFGYKNQVDLPLSLTLEDPAQAAKLTLKIDLMVCKEICIPETLALRAVIPADSIDMAAGMAHGRRLYDFKMENVPLAEQTTDLEIKTVTLGPQALVINAFSKHGFAHADVFAVSGDVALTAVPEVTPDAGDRRLAMIRIEKPGDIEDLSDWMQGRSLSITFVAQREAIEKVFTF